MICVKIKAIRLLLMMTEFGEIILKLPDDEADGGTWMWVMCPMKACSRHSLRCNGLGLEAHTPI